MGTCVGKLGISHSNRGERSIRGLRHTQGGLQNTTDLRHVMLTANQGQLSYLRPVSNSSKVTLLVSSASRAAMQVLATSAREISPII